jgi:hypothetical protein
MHTKGMDPVCSFFSDSTWHSLKCKTPTQISDRDGFNVSIHQTKVVQIYIFDVTQHSLQLNYLYKMNVVEKKYMEYTNSFLFL